MGIPFFQRSGFVRKRRLSTAVGAWLVCLSTFTFGPALAINPYCEHFNFNQLNGWGPAGIAPNVGVSIEYGGPAAPWDRYVLAVDRGGASLLEAGPAFHGDWTTLACGQLCFDIKLFVDGDGIGWVYQNIAPYFIITSGSLRAMWTANTTITEPGGANPGWHRFCAPLGPLCNGQLPSNNQGTWQMLDGAPVTAFPTLLQNVQHLYFMVDYGSIIVEETGYDNICLSSGACGCDCDASCLNIWREKILCKPAPGNQYTYSFQMNNFSGQTIQSIQIVPPSGVTVSPSVINGPIPKGTGQGVTLTIGGAASGQQVCLQFKALNTAGVVFCCSEHCITLPACPCVQVSDGVLRCSSLSASGVPQYTFTMDNLSGSPATDFFIIPTPSTAVVTPQWFHYNTPVQPYGSFGTKQVSITGVAPGQQVCLRFVFVNNSASADQCCYIEKCFTIPSCLPNPCCPGDCCPNKICCIPAALIVMDGTVVSLEGKVISGSVGGAAWIQETDRSSALLLLTEIPLAPGDVVNVSGEITTEGYNRALIVQGLETVGSEPPIDPLWMNNRTIGGGGLNEFTPGITGAEGLNNVGLLIRTWGWVTSAGDGFFYLDDGSRLHDPTGNTGVRVFTQGLTNPAVGEFAVVTGHVSASLFTPTGESMRVLVPRSQDDIDVGLDGGPILSAPRMLGASAFSQVP